MSRAGYAFVRWRGAVARAIRGKRGQAFLREMIIALDAMPEKRLIAGDLVRNDFPMDEQNGCCAIGSVAIARGLDVEDVDPYDREQVADIMGIAPALAAEIEWRNDQGNWKLETPEERWVRVRKWVESNLTGDSQGVASRVGTQKNQ